jgi:LysM repeat protein
VVAVGIQESARQIQANIRIASDTPEIGLTSTLNAAVARVAATRPVAKYVVQYGDTLSGIASRFAVRGGWPALYVANRRVIGPDPDIIHPGAVLVLPGQLTPARYRVAAGDTLSGIAAGLAVRGGWPALYAANRRVIGPDPDIIHPGTVLTVPRPAAPSPAAPRPAPSPTAPRPAPSQRPAPPPPAPAGGGHPPAPGKRAPAAAATPRLLKTVLLAVGLLIGAALLAGLVVVVVRRQRQRRRRGAEPRTPGFGGTHIVVADHDRLVVTRSTRDGAVYVLRPEGEDPRAILRVARLVLPEGPYWELAARLGMPAGWPIVLADHDRVVVARHMGDDTVYVLRPPGTDARAILRVARLVLPEDPYQELAEHLGVPASWPME